MDYRTLEDLIQWYREHFPEWTDSDCIIMAERDYESE